MNYRKIKEKLLDTNTKISVRINVHRQDIRIKIY